MHRRQPSHRRTRLGSAAALAVILAFIGLVTGRAAGVFGTDLVEETTATVTLADSYAQVEEPSPAPAMKVEPAQRIKAVKERRTGPGAGGGDLKRKVEELLADQPPPPATFRISTFNVLGHSHTTPGGNKKGFAPGTTRIGWAADLLRAQDIDVVGLQEFEAPQFNAFVQRTGDLFGGYPGLSMGTNVVRNSIVWRNDRWSLVKGDTIPIPYFRGNRVPMPYVLLQHRETGRQMYVINIHNPTSNPRRGNNARWRALGTQLEIGLVRELRATGVPVVLMGDFNERDKAFCTVTQQGQMNAANGGSAGPPCRTPPNMGIDWIFGTQDIGFADYVRLSQGVIGRVSDHPMIISRATLAN